MTSSASTTIPDPPPAFDPSQFIDLNLNCKLCEKCFTRKDAADRHAQTHYEFKYALKQFKCPYPNCGKAYGRKLDLQRHQYRFHERNKNKNSQIEPGGSTTHENQDKIDKDDTNKSSDNEDETSNDEDDSHCSDDFSSNDDLGLSDEDMDDEEAKDKDSDDNDDDSDPLVKKDVELMKAQDAEKPFDCFTCGQRFKFENTLLQHSKIHFPPPSSSSCPVCNKVFRSIQGVERHLKSHSGYTTENNQIPESRPGSKFLCTICGKYMNNAGRFRKHMAIHSGIKPFLCSHCATSFVTKYDLNRHEKIHTQAKEFKCTFEGCEKAYRENRRLVEHMRIHTNDRQFQCQTCHKAFTNSTILYYHMKVHTGERRYQCELCPDKSYTRSSDLNRHMRSHTGEKPFVCETCFKSYTKKQDLLKHQRLHLEGIQRHKCPYCPADFTTLKYQRRHIVKFHGSAQPQIQGVSLENPDSSSNSQNYDAPLNTTEVTATEFIVMMQ